MGWLRIYTLYCSNIAEGTWRRVRIQRKCKEAVREIIGDRNILAEDARGMIVIICNRNLLCMMM